MGTFHAVEAFTPDVFQTALTRLGGRTYEADDGTVQVSLPPDLCKPLRMMARTTWSCWADLPVRLVCHVLDAVLVPCRICAVHGQQSEATVARHGDLVMCAPCADRMAANALLLSGAPLPMHGQSCQRCHDPLTTADSVDLQREMFGRLRYCTPCLRSGSVRREVADLTAH